jgi:hypothetical protein
MNEQLNVFDEAIYDTLSHVSKPAPVAPAAFEHITINTGHSCLQRREAVDAEVALRLSDLIARALANQGWTDLKPFGEDSRLHVSVAGSALLAHLYSPGAKPGLAEPLVRIAASTTGSDGAEFWTHVRSHAPCVGPGVLTRPPTTAWIAASFDVSGVFAEPNIQQVLAVVSTMQWVGDFERCLAWGFVSWLESTHRAA